MFKCFLFLESSQIITAFIVAALYIYLPYVIIMEWRLLTETRQQNMCVLFCHTCAVDELLKGVLRPIFFHDFGA